MSPSYTDEEFLDAVDGTTSTHVVAEEVGCTPQTAHRRLYDLAKEGDVVFPHVPYRRGTAVETLVLPPEDAIEGLHSSPEEWPEPFDEEAESPEEALKSGASEPEP